MSFPATILQSECTLKYLLNEFVAGAFNSILVYNHFFIATVAIKRTKKDFDVNKNLNSLENIFYLLQNIYKYSYCCI